MAITVLMACGVDVELPADTCDVDRDGNMFLYDADDNQVGVVAPGHWILASPREVSVHDLENIVEGVNGSV